MKIRWRLRMAAAQREVWSGSERRRLLAERAGLELSGASVSALMTKETLADQDVDADRAVHRAALHSL